MRHSDDLCHLTPCPGVEDDGRLHVAIGGELDSSEATSIRVQLERIIGSRCAVVLHIDALTFLGASGLAVFVRLQRAMSERGGTLVICGAGPRHRRLFEWTGLEHLLGDEETERTRMFHG